MGKGDGRGSKEHTYAVTLVYFDRPGSRCSPQERSRETRSREAHFSGNGILFYVRIGIPVVSFLCLKVTIVSMVSFARKNETIESIQDARAFSVAHVFGRKSSSQYPVCLLRKVRFSESDQSYA